MDIISADTRISALIRANPAAIDAIASINSHFRKLQNPFLRKFLAPRVTIGEAAKIGRCSLEDFFEKLKPLGFIIDYGTEKDQAKQEEQQIPVVYHKTLDVRSHLAEGKDPFGSIMSTVAELNTGEVLLLVNTFEPVPLIRILTERGYGIQLITINSEEVHTYIECLPGATPGKSKGNTVSDTDFEKKLESYGGRITKIDVRALPMPQPMVRILEALTMLDDNGVLFVHHKKVPLFLLPELKEQNYDHVLRHVADEVELLIYKKD